MKISILIITLLIHIIARANEFEDWFSTQNQIASTGLFANINRADSRPGTVVASPSKSRPDYYYHWVRDASLVMLTIERLYQESKLNGAGTQQDLLALLKDYADITRIHQQKQTPAGMGEVKYHVDGNPFTGSWGRPQNDGPALRALTFIKYARILMAQGQISYVKEVLYDSRQPSQSIIKKDLEYVSHNWQQHDFDLWEESMGHHFFTRICQRRALLEGAELARQMGDHGAASWYDQQARALESQISSHWDEQRGFLRTANNRSGGIDYKQGLDSSVIIAAIEMQKDGDQFFSILDDRYMATANKLRQTFANIYSINKNYPHLGTAIGRYPEDQYDGYDTGKIGNPWLLTTMSFASYYYKIARALKQNGRLKVTYRNRDFYAHLANTIGLESDQLTHARVFKQGEKMFDGLVHALIEEGDRYVARVRFHLGPDGAMSEQMNRESGYMQGAAHLTWSYSSFINAFLDRP
jgi:glucoamylase